MKKLLQSLGSVAAVVGTQWGDEGKGKIVDILTEHFDIIARAAGGANAGHTIVVNGEKHVFHLLPSGCLHEGKKVFLGAGMVVHFPTLIEEIDTLRQAGIDIVPRLVIASNAHVLFDFHKEVDVALELERTQEKGEGIGTTKRGIGPAYMDKAERTGFRIERLLGDLSSLREDLEKRAEIVAKRFNVTVDVDGEIAALKPAKDLLQQQIQTEVPAMLHAALDEGKKILVEGAQGLLLDIDHGSYPYVTSSATTSTAALHCLGLPPQALQATIGVAKAYCTRVGGGGFPTEADEEMGQKLRDRGGEYGATTGRPRRCGWLCLDDLKRVSRMGGITHWNLTKLDVLDELSSIPVCTAKGGETPVYENLPGWQTSTQGLQSFESLPENAKHYVQYIEEKTGIPVALIGTGPERGDMIVNF